MKFLLFYACAFTSVSMGFKYIETCNKDQYLDPNNLQCVSCPVNSSMVPASDGFGCTCDEHSIKATIGGCKKCNSTELLTADGTACVPRRCQKDSSGRLACRRCPADYIIATQNFDGSPLKEVQCIKCARDFRAQAGKCVKCQSCTCTKFEVAVRGACLPKGYVGSRPKPENNRLLSNAFLDIVKFEYLCKSGDIRACRTLANICVRSLYDTDKGGPCQLWLQSILTTNNLQSLQTPSGLPELTLDTIPVEGLASEEIKLPKNLNTIKIILAAHNVKGGLDFITEEKQCFLPLSLKLGVNFIYKFNMNLTELYGVDQGSNFAPYYEVSGKLLPIPLLIKKPSGYVIQRGLWKSNYFRRYFVIDRNNFTIDNVTAVTLLKEIVIRAGLRRENSRASSLILHLSMEAQYSTLSVYEKTAEISVKFENELPSAGVLKVLEIWGGLLGALSAIYALIQWRGSCRRGSITISLAPLLAGHVADALFAATLIACLHALASETVTTGLVLPLSSKEEITIEAMLYSALALKIIRVLWLNWWQCCCDVFLLDWSEYHGPMKDEESYNWRTTSVAREWLALQTYRRTNPVYTVATTLIILHLMKSWISTVPSSRGYHISIAAIAWWSAYVVIMISQWLVHKLSGNTCVISRVCRTTGVSLLVFQEEFYAHYVHGRNDDAADLRSLTGPLSACRLICAPQLRTVIKQLSSPGNIGTLVDSSNRQNLRTKFLATFFERALDGLSWIASERNFLERLFDVELTTRESGSISVLLYDPAGSSPSCLGVTWWGQECNLAVLDAALFTVTFMGTGEPLVAALTVLCIWQIMRHFRTVFGRRNFRTKTDVNDNWN